MSCRAQCRQESQRHLLTFSPPDLPDGYAECLLCGDWITAVDFLDEPCGATRKEKTTMPTLKTAYGPASLVMAGAWPGQVCPVCGREHAHPPGVTADYWPMCWDCWKARPTGFQRREED